MAHIVLMVKALALSWGRRQRSSESNDSHGSGRQISGPTQGRGRGLESSRRSRNSSLNVDGDNIGSFGIVGRGWSNSGLLGWFDVEEGGRRACVVFLVAATVGWCPCDWSQWSRQQWW